MSRARLPKISSPPALKRCATAFFGISCFSGVFISLGGDICIARGCNLCFSCCLQLCSHSEDVFLMCQCLLLDPSKW